jgi:DNA-binding MarR family transcriptional regulator
MAEVLLPLDDEELQKSPRESPRNAIMTSLGIVEGEVLLHLEEHGATALRQLMRELEWPSPIVTMAIGALIRQGLVRASQHELELLLEPRSSSSARR